MPITNTFFRDSLISLLLFLLLSEWLRPLAWMADASIQIGPILVVFAICIAIDCFKVPYVWGWTAKSVIILLFIGFMFDREGFLTGAWIIDLVRIISQDIGSHRSSSFRPYQWSNANAALSVRLVAPDLRRAGSHAAEAA